MRLLTLAMIWTILLWLIMTLTALWIICATALDPIMRYQDDMSIIMSIIILTAPFFITWLIGAIIIYIISKKKERNSYNRTD